MYRCETISWSTANLPMATSSQKNDSPLAIHCQSLLNEGGAWRVPTPSVLEGLAGLILCRSYAGKHSCLRDHDWKIHTTSRGQHFTSRHLILQPLDPFCSSSVFSGSWLGGELINTSCLGLSTRSSCSADQFCTSLLTAAHCKKRSFSDQYSQYPRSMGINGNVEKAVWGHGI